LNPGEEERMTTTREGLEAALYEIKRVVVGQDAMLERVLVALLTGGHVLLEGVPGLAKTLTVKTLAGVVGGSFQRVQFTPDLVPADLVGTRVLRPDTGSFDVELGPVVCNFLLADEINRAPAKVQSALLEVMEEHQVTIAGQTFRVPEPYLVLATQNPIESEGTYPLPEAQTDRFLMKILVDYPTAAEETAVVGRSLEPPVEVIERLTADDLLAFRREVDEVYVDGGIVAHAVQLVDATRSLTAYGLGDIAHLVDYGASPRGPIGLIQAARALALLRGRRHVISTDVRDLSLDVLRHRLVLSYDALSEGVSADDILGRVLEAVPSPDAAPVHTMPPPSGPPAPGYAPPQYARPPGHAPHNPPPGGEYPPPVAGGGAAA
jgi:MoxR-like ATPase